ncbi:MAG: hypothetical protein J6W18_02960 [Bacteroidaceae bacterium]|nr:hypothetical protein [Bacteroidaceae bacterium]
MKKFLILMIAIMLPFATVYGKKNKQNLLVWGEVVTADDGNGYLTMYKNSPAEITAQFHFVYKDKSKSVMYDLFMPDTVAELHDPVPVDKPVKEVVVDNIVYSAMDAEGKKYSTSDPDDPVLAMLLVDLFDFYHDLFWFDVTHRARYYDGRHYDNWTPSNSSRYNKTHTSSSRPKASDLDLTKVDDESLLIGAVAVAAASAGMIVGVVRNWDVPDDRFPYLSLSPQLQFFTQTGNMRDVIQMKWRMGNRGGVSLMGDLGYSTGSLLEQGVFNPGFTWSLGAGLDIGAFSLSFHGKPATRRHQENFLTCQLGYDIFVTKDLAIDISGGAGIFEYTEGDVSQLYWDFPISLGLLWKF